MRAANPCPTSIIGASRTPCIERRPGAVRDDMSPISSTDDDEVVALGLGASTPEYRKPSAHRAPRRGFDAERSGKHAAV